ncbi:MAG: hypothetical protein M9895_17665 [Aquamicrobium sp.]|uniref:DUF883 family protein n=1 Tax=Aquamicrobium sp. TaxID=1872579 RepID=UPI00349EBD07|nr:hypothetical protein [Aquamicrobium sp.]MCO5158808.1 hypothetical protein [Aquamicrobium sp.]
MATAASGKAGKAEDKAVPADLEAELAQLREDVARLTEQLAKTGEHTMSAARRAATEGAEQLRVKGEEAMYALKSNAGDIERQVTDAVREKPLTSLAIAAGVGFFFALLSRR